MPGGPVVLPTRDDPDRWIEIATYPVTVGVGLATVGEETIVVLRDVTEARRREAVRETFIGVLSHELRTPVTTIFGGAKLLAREHSTLDEETKRGIFRDIHEEAERLQRLVEDVVALNRFGEDAGDIGWEPVLLQRLLPRVAESEEERWPGVTFRLDIEPGLATVIADPTYVEQVVRNLLSNAAKYGGPGSTVTLAAEPGKGEVLVKVLDDGPGVPRRGDAPAVRAVLSFTGHRCIGERRGDRAVRVRQAGRCHGRPDLGHAATGGRRRVRVRVARAG